MSLVPGWLHKGIVVTCVGLTVGGLLYTAGLLNYHYKVVLPEREQQEENRERQAELDFEDKAPILKA